LNEVKDMTMTGTVNIMGTELNFTQKVITGSAYSMELGMQGMVLMKELMSNGQFSKTQQGAAQELDEEEKEEMKENAHISQELYMKSNGYKFTLNGIEAVDGKDAYVVAIKSPAGRDFTNYYDVKTGFKVKSMYQTEGPGGTPMTVQTFFAKYDEWKDVKIPTKIVVDLGRFKQEIEAKEVKVNTGLKAEDVK
jgi:zinc protease